MTFLGSGSMDVCNSFNMTQTNPSSSDRLLSIDFFRGATMLLLIGEFTGLFPMISHGSEQGGVFAQIGSHFDHHEWHGLKFWDLIQPFFMFIVGLSMPMAVASRLKRGDSMQNIRSHAFKRSGKLLLLGWGLYCVFAGEIVFRFQDVLCQIAFTYFVAFLIINRSVKFQLIFSFALLVLAEAIYRLFPLDGFNQAFTDGHNFGYWVEYMIEGEGGRPTSWASVNVLSTTAHTIWGVLVGKFLMSDKSASNKLKQMLIAGVVLVVVGYGLDFVTPIIKKIATTSFVIVSGGWAILVMACSYWVIDVKKNNRWVIFFSVVSMNSLFIYLFSIVGGAELISTILHPFTFALFSWISESTAEVVTYICAWMALWYVCYWMYSRKLFIKI